MKRLRKILLSQNNLAKTLGYAKFFAATKFNHHLEIVKNLSFKNVLVLAPHPDDDILGVGGTLAMLSGQKSQLTVVYFCNGSGGTPEGRNDFGQPKRINQELIDIRKQEARKSAKFLGITEQLFFGYQDGTLASGTSVIRALKELMERVKPDIIFAPSFLDNHPDHRATNEVLINALNVLERSTLSKNNISIWAFEVWTPLFANRIVDISPKFDVKKRAILAHESQLKSRAYDKAVLGLNQYRAEINGISGYAEAFFATTPEIYRKLYQKS